MPDLLTLNSPDWTLVVWSKEVDGAQAKLNKTLMVRGKQSASTCFRFDPLLHLTDLDSRERELCVSGAPIFFENKLYEFDFQFQPAHLSAEPSIKHYLQSIEDTFRYTQNSLRGSVNFGNHVGWFKLVLEYQTQGKKISQSISFEVLPTKMDAQTDLVNIQQVIDKKYPLFRFSFVQKTQQELGRSRKPYEKFPLLWLAQFESLRLELEKGVRHILQSPHTRLLPHKKSLRADQLKGALSPKLEERIRSALVNGDCAKKYAQEKKHLSVDTPENRFIKMVLVRCANELSQFSKRIKDADSAPENCRLSNTFFEQIDSWKTPLNRFLKQPLFREIGRYEGINSESLVLHQKSGYALVYRVWQQLKLYLDVFGHHASISMKSIAELYEVWCVLEIRRILIEDLGFCEKTSRKAALLKKGEELLLKNGMGAAFNLERGAIKIHLAHEPIFRKPKKGKQGIYSWVTDQEPDIVLEAEYTNGEKIRWIFDAKYRIDTGNDDIDYAPVDAINQMHRYRDALIHIHEADDGWQEKSRPILGAYVLYPGWFNHEASKNPYHEAISEVGIGAFPLLPNTRNNWLTEFLLAQFGVLGEQTTAYKMKTSDHFYVQEAARIGYSGMSLSKYKNLVLTVALGSKRSKEYLDGFKQGEAKWYHIPESTVVSKQVQRSVMRELKSCAFVVPVTATDQRCIEYSYDILSVRLVKRREITDMQAGAKAKPASEDQLYWLFELGRVTQLKALIDVSGLRDFKFKLSSQSDLATCKTWAELPNYYDFLQKV